MLRRTSAKVRSRTAVLRVFWIALCALAGLCGSVRHVFAEESGPLPERLAVPSAPSASASTEPAVLAPIAPVVSATASATTPIPAPAASSAKPAATPSAAPSGSAKAEAQADTWVRLKDKKVFEIKAARAGVTALDRARASSRALESASAEAGEDDVRTDTKDGVAIIYVGKTPIVQLGAEDVAASGDASLEVHAQSVEAKIKDGLSTERKRRAAASTVFSISLLVFSGLIALLLIRKLGELADRGRTWMQENPDRAPTLKAFGIDVFSPHVFRGGLSVTLGAAKFLVQVGVGYAWVIFALSLFESTRGYTSQLTKAVVNPLSGLTSRLAESVPMLIVGAVSLFAVFVAIRFIGLYFRSVARGEAQTGWVPPDLAIPTSVLIRAGIVVIAMVLGIPVVTGSSEGSLARAGVVAIAALGIAVTPLLATAAMGVLVVYGRRLRVGDMADVGGRSGRILGIDLLEVRLEDDHGFEVRVPHLLALVHPTRVLGRSRLVRVTISIAISADQTVVRDLLTQAASSVGQTPKVEMAQLDANGVLYEVSCRMGKKDTRGDLLAALADVLLREKITLGFRPRGSEIA